MKIAIIGTGVMGTGVGLTLLGKGHQVYCTNRTPQNAQALIEAGAHYCATPREAAENASHVIILVWNEAALRTALDGDNGLYAAAGEGRVFIDMSTQLPATAQEEAREFAAR